MDDNEAQTKAVLSILADRRRPIIVGLLGYGVLAAIHPSLPFLCLGPILIWYVARTLNRRHDPRHAKRPPDNP